MAICTRSKKYESIASEAVTGKLLEALVSFMHRAR
jgi:hypothetical protein